MNHLLRVAVVVVHLALAGYTLAGVDLLRNKKRTVRYLVFLWAGWLCDLAATAFMVAGSRHFSLTFHGIIGYLALGAMLYEAISSLLSFYRGHFDLGRKDLKIFLFVYAYWIAAYITGAVMVMITHSS